mmetsp:Transcript_6065/g.8572  ORF Transcript_6065/g.8572 Transcript_6065/m.8572 type:complete len:270 (-) Transcript_6065:960-1769(-)
MPVVGLHDYEKKDDDDEKKQNELYTGGNRQGGGGSGLSVIGPPPDDDDDDKEDDGANHQVGKMFLRAQQNGQDDGMNDEAATLPKRQITMYRNGFTIDDGPFRSLEDPANLPFLRDVSRGLVPRELEQQGQGAFDLELVDRRAEMYTASFKPFTGQGQSLGTTPSSVPTSSLDNAPSSDDQNSTPPISVDPTLPSTQIQVRLATGGRIRLSLNHIHTVADIELMVRSQAGPTDRPFYLLAGYPPKPLSDKQISITDAGLLNASLTQKFA